MPSDSSVPRSSSPKKFWDKSRLIFPRKLIFSRERDRDEHRQGLVRRVWIYQGERFPIVKHGLLIAIFSGAAVGYGASLTTTLPALSSACVAFLSTFAFFWQMRVADEFKDIDDDVQYRPYRPVPRGLISLRELAILGVASAAVQASLALWLAPALLGYLLGIWVYFGLMCKEFFVRDWLKAHPVAYVFSHMMIVPLIGGYAVAAQTIPTTGTVLYPSLLPFLATCFFNGLVIELGRKIRLPAGEEIGVETYSALWGLPTAVRLWLGSVLVTAIFSLWGAWYIHALAIVVPILAALAGWIGIQAWPWLGRFSAHQRPQSSPPIPQEKGQPEVGQKMYDILDTPTAIWTLGVYLSLGWLPWILGR